MHLVNIKILTKFKGQMEFWINSYCYQSALTDEIDLSDTEEYCIELLMITKDDHGNLIKIFIKIKLRTICGLFCRLQY